MGIEETPEQLVAAAEELAREAGEVCCRWFRSLDEDQVRFKGPRDPVTVADLEAERVLVEGIRRRFPAHSILAEEGGESPGEGDTQWIVDPLDGTVNFSHGLPLFAVAVAVRRRSQLLASVVHAPVLGETFCASLGGGATCNGQPIHVSSTASLGDALLATGFAYGRNEADDDNVGHFCDLILRCRDIRRMGSAALDFAQVAAGRLDGFWELHLAPWDVAPGALLVQEAGGSVTDFGGGAEVVETGTIVATNGALHAELQEILTAS